MTGSRAGVQIVAGALVVAWPRQRRGGKSLIHMKKRTQRKRLKMRKSLPALRKLPVDIFNSFFLFFQERNREGEGDFKKKRRRRKKERKNIYIYIIIIYIYHILTYSQVPVEWFLFHIEYEEKI